MSRHHAFGFPRRRWEHLRRAVLDAANWRCAKCGRYGNEVDHIQPLDRGGDPWALENLQCLCRGCHIAKTRAENRREPTSRTGRLACPCAEVFWFASRLAVSNKRVTRSPVSFSGCKAPVPSSSRGWGAPGLPLRGATVVYSGKVVQGGKFRTAGAASGASGGHQRRDSNYVSGS